jgi:hypothetical protein
MDFVSESHFFLGGAPSAVLGDYGEPIRRDTVDHGMGVVQVIWRYSAQEFTFWLGGPPFRWTITGPGPRTYRGLSVGDTRKQAIELYGTPTRIDLYGDTTSLDWVMAPRWYPQFGVSATVVSDTVRLILVGELVLVVM